MEKPVLAALLSVKSHTLTDFEKHLLETFNPLGIILFDRNITTQEQTAKLIYSIKETICRNDVIIALDEEGGRVSKLKYDTNKMVSQNILGQLNNIDTTKKHAKITSAKLKDIGANMIFAPVLDLDYKDTTIALKNRCFSHNKNIVAHHGKAMCDAYIEQGICPCIKHIPGHGRATLDPHALLPIIDAPIKELETDFYPFIQLNKMPAAMSAHILLKQIDSQYPVTTSKKAIKQIIRDTIGFDGLLFSDAIDMHALEGNIVQKATSAWEAGCDIVCYCSANEQELSELCYNAKYINDKGLERLEKIKNIISSKKSTIILDNEIKEYYTAISGFAENHINYDATEVLHQYKN